MSDINVQIFTPSRELFKGEVSELLLPSFDGEVGVLPGHKDFTGLLGTGVLKIVQNGDDYWFVVSSGVYEVQNGEVTVLAEVGESAKEVDIEAAQVQEKELEEVLKDQNQYSDEFADLRVRYERAQARREVHRRTNLN